jgi:hypothetical protein
MSCHHRSPCNTGQAIFWHCYTFLENFNHVKVYGVDGLPSWLTMMTINRHETPLSTSQGGGTIEGSRSGTVGRRTEDEVVNIRCRHHVTARVAITTHQVSFDTPSALRDGLGGESQSNQRHPIVSMDDLGLDRCWILGRLHRLAYLRGTPGRRSWAVLILSCALKARPSGEPSPVHFSGGEACPFCFAQSAKASLTIMAAGI